MALWLEVLLVAAVTFLSAWVQACTGFGCALICMSLLPLFLPMSTCSAVSAVMVVVIGIQMSLSLRQHFRLRTILVPVACCMSTINLGLLILDTFDEMLLRIILAGLMLLVTALFFVMRARKIVLPDCWWIAGLVGLVTGISTGMFNIVGPFLLMYYINVCDDTLHLKASLEFSFLIAGLYSAAMHLLVYQNITLALAPHLLVTALAVIIAGGLGLRLYRKVNRDKIALTVYILLPIMAGMLILNGMK